MDRIKVGTLTKRGFVPQKSTPSRKLSSECWGIQMFGRKYCKTCPHRGTKECGGKRILKTGKNAKGYTIGKNGLR